MAKPQTVRIYLLVRNSYRNVIFCKITHRNRKRQYNNNIHNTNFNIAKFASVQNPPQDFIICNFDDPTKDVKNDYLDVNKYLDPKNDITFIDNREDAIEAMQHLIHLLHLLNFIVIRYLFSRFEKNF